MRIVLVALTALALIAGLVLGYRCTVAQSTPTAHTAAVTGSSPSQPPEATPARQSSAVIEVVDGERLDQLITGRHGRTVLDFHAEWCKPCKELSPRLAALALEHPEIQVISIDVSAAEALSKRYGAEALPLLVRIDDGTETARIERAPSDAELREWLGLAAAR